MDHDAAGGSGSGTSATTLPPVTEQVNHGQAPPFGFLCSFYEAVAERQKPVDRRKLLHQLLQRWRVKVGNNAFPLIRLLIPERDRHRPNYGIKELSLAKVYSKALGLDQNSTAAKSMKNWKKPTKAYQAVGDFAQICYDVIRDRSYLTGTGSLTITSLNTLLDNLADADGEAAKSAIFRKFLEVCTAEEQRWIIRIILKDLRIGLREKTILHALHPDASDVFDICTDLQYVCYALPDPTKRWPRENKDIHLFAPFKPMLCSFGVANVAKIVERMHKQPFIIEEKVDGERMQMHYRKGQFAWFSRKSTRYTYLYGSDLYSGSVAKYIHKAINKSVHELILDGEMLVWMPLEQKFAPFGNLKTFAGTGPQAELGPDDPRPCFKVFDVLYVNGTSLIKKPLRERRRVLPQLIEEVPGRLELNELYEGLTERDIIQHLDDIMERKGEGLVIKHPESQYYIGGRELDWIKVKPEYVDSFGDPPDLVVVGGYWGQGRLRSGKITGFMCAVYDEDKSKATGSHCFKTFCRLATGFSVSDFDEIHKWCGGKWREWIKGKTRLSWLEHDHEVPDVYIDPADSFMIKIKAAGLIEATGEYATQYTFRFPRAIGFKQEKDKSLNESWSYRDMLAALETVTKLKLESSGLTFSKKRKPARVGVARKSAKILDSMNGGAKVQKTNDLFAGLTFYVLEGTSSHPKSGLESLILSHGGDYRQSVGTDPELKVISGRIDFLKAKAIVAKDKYDIIKPDWILDSIARGRLLKLARKYLIHSAILSSNGGDISSEDDAQDVELNVTTVVDDDVVSSTGSAEEEPVKSSRLDDSSDTTGQSDMENHTEDADQDTEESTEDEDEQAASVSGGLGVANDKEARDYDPEKIFRYLIFFIHDREKRDATLQQKITDSGGKVVGDLESEAITHIIASKGSPGNLINVTKYPKRKRIVLDTWVSDCLKEGTLRDEELYRP